MAARWKVPLPKLTDMALLEVENIRRSFGGLVALDHVTFKVMPEMNMLHPRSGFDKQFPKFRTLVEQVSQTTDFEARKKIFDEYSNRFTLGKMVVHSENLLVWDFIS